MVLSGYFARIVIIRPPSAWIAPPIIEAAPASTYRFAPQDVRKSRLRSYTSIASALEV
jgi:hypothetical protein